MKLKKKNKKDLSFLLGLGGVAKGVGQCFGIGVLSLQNMKNTSPIGSDVDEKNTIPGTATVYFATQESVTTLITQLTKMRKDMKNATNPVSVGRSDERRKTPRKRAKR